MPSKIGFNTHARRGLLVLLAVASLSLGGSCRRHPTLHIEDRRAGRGAAAQAGRRVAIHYVATLANGEPVDNSRARGHPTEFVLGQGMVIAGWDQGLVGMREGGLRRLTVPAALAYGARGAGPAIPPGSTLVFEIELLTVR